MITDLLICPKCERHLGDELNCSVCGCVYEHKNGVYIMLPEETASAHVTKWSELDADGFPVVNFEKNDADIAAYYAKFNEETIRAREEHFKLAGKLIEGFSGVVCDFATGRGLFLQEMLESWNKNFKIVCTDIDGYELMITRKRRNTCDGRVFYVASDGLCMAFKDESFDYVTTFAGFGNIPKGDIVAREMYRILKHGGKAVILCHFINKDSKSYELAKKCNVERGMVEEFLTEDLSNAGFDKITVDIVAEAVWDENPADLIPAAGDSQRYCIVKAEKF